MSASNAAAIASFLRNHRVCVRAPAVGGRINPVTVWDDLVGQATAVESLSAATADARAEIPAQR